MSSDGSVQLVFAGDQRLFRLGIANLIALQEKRSSGPLEILMRLQLGSWRIEDITETIRIGLIGAHDKETPEIGKAARELVEAHVRPPHITQHVLTAQAVLLSALQGVPDDPVGKKDGATTAAPEMQSSPPPPSMETVP